MFLIKLFRDRFNHLEVSHILVGSDVCEIFYRKVGGMLQNERSYDGCASVERVGALARIAEFEVDLKGPCYSRAHKKQTHIWFDLELQIGVPLADLKDYSSIGTEEHIVAALHGGFAETQITCAALGMRPIEIEPGCWWIAIWVHKW